MVDEQIAAAGQVEPRLTNPPAQRVSVEEAPVRLLVEQADALQHGALQEEAKPAQAFRLEPLALVLLAPRAGELIDRLDVPQVPVGGAVAVGLPLLPGAEA